VHLRSTSSNRYRRGPELLKAMEMLKVDRTHNMYIYDRKVDLSLSCITHIWLSDIELSILGVVLFCRARKYKLLQAF